MADKDFQLKFFEEKETVILKARKPDSCILAIFGATGDLSRRKLFPSLYHLALDKALPEGVAIIGVGSEEMSDDAFRERLRSATEPHCRGGVLDNSVWAQLASRMHYVGGDVKDASTFAKLRTRIAETDRQYGSHGNHLFFLAIPPSIIELILRQLSTTGLLYPIDSVAAAHWRRVVIEKPFGRDLSSAQRLNRLISELVKESQVFRVDHYLGKETVQNILVFRFGNSIFEPIWNRKYIDHVQITAAEEIGIEGRGAFYEETGVIRDIVENHLMQVLALSAMEPPISLKSNDIHDEKAKVFRALRPIIGEVEAKENIVLGQYKGYREEPNVAPNSRIPTYAALRVMIDNWRWEGVPFYFRAGKKLSNRLTEISVTFRQIPFCLFGGENVCAIFDPAMLNIRIQPDEGIALRFLCKVPGDDLAVNSVLMDFSYANIFKGKLVHGAYERLFLDAMRGDQTLFSRADGVELEWAYVEPIIDVWEAGKLDPYLYEPGSDGPKEADKLFIRPGRFWKEIG